MRRLTNHPRQQNPLGRATQTTARSQSPAERVRTHHPPVLLNIGPPCVPSLRTNRRKVGVLLLYLNRSLAVVVYSSTGVCRPFMCEGQGTTHLRRVEQAYEECGGAREGTRAHQVAAACVGGPQRPDSPQEKQGRLLPWSSRRLIIRQPPITLWPWQRTTTMSKGTRRATTPSRWRKPKPGALVPHLPREGRAVYDRRPSP